jgi:hypothetical protein
VPGYGKGNLAADYPSKISKLRMTCRAKFRSHNLSAKIKCRGRWDTASLQGPPSVILASHIFHLGSDDSYNAALVRQIALFHHLSVENQINRLRGLACFQYWNLFTPTLHTTNQLSISLLSRYVEVVEKGLHNFNPSHVATNLRLRLPGLHLAHTASGLLAYDSGECFLTSPCHMSFTLSISTA